MNFRRSETGRVEFWIYPCRFRIRVIKVVARKCRPVRVVAANAIKTIMTKCRRRNISSMLLDHSRFYVILNKSGIAIFNIPKVKPYVAIKALLTIIIPTDVTILNVHAARSRANLCSSLLVIDIFIYCFNRNL